MANQELSDYVKTNRNNGVQDSEIRQALTASGWQQADIDQALLAPSAANSAPTHKSAKTITVVVTAAVLILLLAAGAFFFYKSRSKPVVQTAAVDNLKKVNQAAAPIVCTTTDCMVQASQVNCALAGADLEFSVTDPDSKEKIQSAYRYDIKGSSANGCLVSKTLKSVVFPDIKPSDPVLLQAVAQAYSKQLVNLSAVCNYDAAQLKGDFSALQSAPPDIQLSSEATATGGQASTTSTSQIDVCKNIYHFSSTSAQ